MKVNIFLSIVLFTILSIATAARAEDKPHFNFMKKAISAWGNNQYDGLRNVINSTEENTKTIEYYDLKYNVMIRPSNIQQEINNMLIMLANKYSISTYYLLNYNSINNLFESKNEVYSSYNEIKDILGINGSTDDMSIDEDYILCKTNNVNTVFTAKYQLINDIALTEAIQLFVLRKDVLNIIKDTAKIFTNSSENSYIDKTEILPLDTTTITDLNLIKHIIKKYTPKGMEKISINGTNITNIYLDINGMIGNVSLVGSNNQDIINNMIINKVNILTGEPIESYEILEPGWLVIIW
jgi:hypothetical protein